MSAKNSPTTGTDKSSLVKTKEKMPVDFQRDDLIRSKTFSQYHPDILRALLPKERYTKMEAVDIVERYFNTKKEGEN